MASVFDLEKCQDCGGVRFVDFYWKSGEEYSFCKRCGTHFSRTMVRDENGKVVFEGDFPKFEETYQKGYGVYRIQSTDEVSASVGQLKEISEESLVDMKEIYHLPDIDQEKTFFAQWDWVKNEQQLLFGKTVPAVHSMDFEEYMKNTNSI